MQGSSGDLHNEKPQWEPNHKFPHCDVICGCRQIPSTPNNLFCHNSLSFSSQDFYPRPFIIFVALLWTLSTVSMSNPTGFSIYRLDLLLSRLDFAAQRDVGSSSIHDLLLLIPSLCDLKHSLVAICFWTESGILPLASLCGAEIDRDHQHWELWQ